MHLHALPAFADNYIWMLHDGRAAFVVDPGDAAPVAAALDAQGLRLAGILVTHHHADHTGGLDALRPRLEGPVYGPAREAIPGPFTPLSEGARIDVLGTPFRVIDVPGHTAGHVAYVQDDGSSEPLLFCGDTLFSAGCGRLFEGTPAQMAASLAKLDALPAATRVCCTHEYTLANLRFALAVEPGNAQLQQRLQADRAKRDAQQPTLPSSIALERATNPFLRWAEPEVQLAAQQRAPHPAPDASPVAVFAALRDWKNRF